MSKSTFKILFYIRKNQVTKELTPHAEGKQASNDTEPQGDIPQPFQYLPQHSTYTTDDGRTVMNHAFQFQSERWGSGNEQQRSA